MFRFLITFLSRSFVGMTSPHRATHACLMQCSGNIRNELAQGLDIDDAVHINDMFGSLSEVYRVTVRRYDIVQYFMSWA